MVDVFFFHRYKILINFLLKEIGRFAINMHIDFFKTIVCSRFKCSIVPRWNVSTCASQINTSYFNLIMFMKYNITDRPTSFS